MNPNEFWEQQTQYLLNWANTNPPGTFRSWNPSRCIPLWEMATWPEYVKEATDMYNRYTFDTDRNRWCYAMRPRYWGFHNNDRFYEKTWLHLRARDADFLTSTYNTKSNHHLSRYNEITGNNLLAWDRIVEWGGGSGDFAHFVMDLGYEGEYTIVDLPGTLKVAECNFMDSPKNLRPTLTDTVPEADGRKTLLVSTWALSETPLETRTEVMERLKPDGFLFTYQRGIFGVNNQDYFEEIQREHGGKFEEIPHIRWDGGSAFLCK